MRYLFFFLALLLAAGPAKAQGSPVITPPDSLPAAQAASDTVAAIHRLFAAKRIRRDIISAGVIVAIGVSTFISTEAENKGYHHVGGNSFAGGLGPFGPGFFIIVYTVMAIPLEAGNILWHQRYSQKAEWRAKTDFALHRLEPRLKRKLKARYFR